jgi:hypothetical protein
MMIAESQAWSNHQPEEKPTQGLPRQDTLELKTTFVWSSNIPSLYEDRETFQ